MMASDIKLYMLEETELRRITSDAMYCGGPNLKLIYPNASQRPQESTIFSNTQPCKKFKYNHFIQIERCIL